MNSIEDSTNSPFAELGLRTPPPEEQRNRLGQEDFLRLMSTQLTHQDPTKPMDADQFLGDLAQFASVSGIQELQTSFSTLADSLYSNQVLQASGMVGQQVLVPGSVGMLAEERDLRGAIQLPYSTTDLTVNIFTPDGQLVRQLPLGAQSAGQVPFTWDGLLDNGEYATPGQYQITAQAQSSGQTEAMETSVYAAVQSVSLGGDDAGLVLHLAGLGAVPFSAIQRVS